MPGEITNGMHCNEFDALLSDALDGLLSSVKLESFHAHARSCPVCGTLFAEAEAGRNWLKSLPEVEPPASLVQNILVSTTGVDTQRLRAHVSSAQPRTSWLERARAWADGFIHPVWATVRQPRFAMSFGMAFFSLSVGLSVMGVKAADLRQLSLRPTAIRHAYYSTSGRVVKYYENIRFVYEVESRVREFKRATTPAEPGPSKQQKERKNDTSEEPEQKQERNYSQSDSHLILASARLGPSDDLPVVSVTTSRRFV
jgi:hypothetical protein